MIVAKIIPEQGEGFKGTFETQEEAEKWVQNHSINRSGREYRVTYTQEHLDNRETKFEALRTKREKILTATDWLFVSDFRIETKHRKIYMEYRQYLRDLPRIIGKQGTIFLETFKHFLKRKYPEEFMDGGDSEVILKHFYANIGDYNGTC